MKSYLGLVSEYAKAHKKKNRLTVICIVASVMLVSAVFGMADMSVRAQINEQIRVNGNYHISLGGVSNETARRIGERSDVLTSGWVEEAEGASVMGRDFRVIGSGGEIARQLNLTVTEGRFPENAHEALINEGAREQLGLTVGGAADITWSDGAARQFTITGVYGDTSVLKRRDEHGLLLTTEGVRALPGGIDAGFSQFFIRFNDGVNIRAAVNEIKAEHGLDDAQISESRLVGLLGYSANNNMMQVYYMAAVLFILILTAGTLMISSSFNLSILERTQFFGMLRCLGATKKQIKRYVRLEGLRYCLFGIPAGLVAGSAVMWAAALILRYMNASFFGDMPLFEISLPALIAGAALGFVTVMLASRSPASKAAKVSPQAAVTGNLSDRHGKGISKPSNSKLFRVDTAMGISHAFSDKKNIALVTGSFAVSIILFLCFSILVQFFHNALKPLQPYAPDISVLGADETVTLDRELFERIEALPGVKNAYGRMFAYDVPAKGARGESLATLVSFEEKQFAWFKENLIEGNIDDAEDGGGVLTVYSYTQEWSVGDRISLSLPGGEKDVTITGVLSRSPFDAAAGTQVLICSEPTFTALTGASDYTIIDMQTDEDVADNVRGMLTPRMRLMDRQQGNSEARAAYNTMALFVYGFLAIIALVALINIVNTINASISGRINRYGVMRAVGMSGGQLKRTVTAEAAVYAVTGGVIGCLLGVPLHRLLFTSVITFIWGEAWRLPLAMLLVTVCATVLVTLAAVVSPMKKIKEMNIVNVINAG